MIEITTNIESQEIRRCETASIGNEEHPRAGTTDDVEMFFSVVRKSLGQTFTLKAFKKHWRNLTRLFMNLSGIELMFWTVPYKSVYMGIKQGINQ